MFLELEQHLPKCCEYDDDIPTQSASSQEKTPIIFEYLKRIGLVYTQWPAWTLILKDLVVNALGSAVASASVNKTWFTTWI